MPTLLHLLTLSLLTTLTSSLPHPGADSLASAYALALAEAQTDPSNDPNAHNSNPGDYDQSSSYGGNPSGVNTAAGASGADNGSFELSNGAIAGIAVAVALVVVFGGMFCSLYSSPYSSLLDFPCLTLPCSTLPCSCLCAGVFLFFLRESYCLNGIPTNTQQSPPQSSSTSPKSDNGKSASL